MMLLRNYNLKANIKHIFLYKIVTLIILIWIYDQNNVSSSGSYLEKKINLDSIFNACVNRSLAKHGTQMYEKYQKQGQNLNDGKMNKIIKDDKENYEYLKKGLNNLDSYKKDYKRRHDRKKGLARLDCYYEKRIFDKMDYIYDLAKRMCNDKKTYKKYIYRKFAIRFIIFALLPLLGIIFPILFDGKTTRDRIVRWTITECKNEGNDGHCKLGFIHFSSDEINAIACVNFLFFLALAIIYLLIVTYIIIKIIKYESLKVGKGKMNRKEYINFCKNMLKTKIFV